MKIREMDRELTAISQARIIITNAAKQVIEQPISWKHRSKGYWKLLNACQYLNTRHRQVRVSR